MKKRLITTLIAAAAMVAATPSADAQRHGRHYHQPQHSSHVFISGYQRCGTPVYSERYIVRYDRYHRPVYGYRVIRHRSHHSHRSHHVRPAPRRHYVAPCPPPRRGSRGHISIRF